MTVSRFLLTKLFRTEDNDKLREKVDEALAVYHEYAKTQGTGGNTDGSLDQPGEAEAGKA